MWTNVEEGMKLEKNIERSQETKSKEGKSVKEERKRKARQENEEEKAKLFRLCGKKIKGNEWMKNEMKKLRNEGRSERRHKIRNERKYKRRNERMNEWMKSVKGISS